MFFYQDQQNKEIVYKRPFLSSSKRDWQSFAYSREKIYELKDVEKHLESLDRSLSISVLFHLKFQLLEKVDLEVLAKLIDSNESQEKAMEDILFSWVDEYVNNNDDGIRDFVEDQSRVGQQLVYRAKNLGIQLELVLSYKDQDVLDSKTIEGSFPLRVRDYHGKIKLGYRLDLEAMEEHKTEALMAYSSQQAFERKINKSIREYLSTGASTTLHSLYFELNATVRQTLEEYLNPILEEDGLFIVFVELNVDFGLKPVVRKEINCSVECFTKNNQKVTVNHRLILTLDDLGKFFSSGIDDLDQWVENELQRLTNDFIFEKNFTDLAINFDDVEIKEGMKKEVGRIGYKVKQLITIPDLQRIIPEYIEFEIGGEEEFATRQDELKIKLNIVVMGRVNDISKITWLLSPNITKESIINKIKERVLIMVKRLIHNTEPEEFYMKFDFTDLPGEQSLSDKLQERIREGLKDDFGVSNVEILCKPLATDLAKKFSDIYGVSVPLVIESKLHRFKYVIPVDVQKVNNERWHIFKAKMDALGKKESIELLRQVCIRLKDYVQGRLDEQKHNLPKANEVEDDTQVLEATPVNQQDEQESADVLKDIIRGYLMSGIEIIQKEFGLDILISESWKIELTPEQQDWIHERDKRLKIQKELRDLLLEKQLERGKSLVALIDDPSLEYMQNPEKFKAALASLENEVLLFPDSDQKVQDDETVSINKDEKRK